MVSSTDRAREYADLVRAKLGPHVKQVVLFGSQARGDAREGSDFDFLVVVDQRTPTVRERVLDAGVEMLNRYDQLFASLLYSEEEWRESQRFPIGWNIEREGLAV
jgi:predicted nucleotidyltransferase